MSAFKNVIRRGTRASQPAATTTGEGVLYFVTDENIIERSNGTTWDSYSSPAGSSGKLAQVVNTQIGALATGGTLIPFDDTIPQNTEGTQFMSLAITPTNIANKLKIEVVIQLSNSAGNWYTAALFQDAIANALAASIMYNATAGGGVLIVFTHYMTAGTISATTFKVRAGGAFAGTTTFNGNAGGRMMGGIMASSITISEIVP